jgi:hypothetical protein
MLSLKPIIAFGTAFTLSLSANPVNTAGDYKKDMVVMVSEAENYNTAIETNCFFDEELKEASDIAWADGLMGKAIDMGQSYREHYRFSVEPVWEAKGFTFNTWINWRGAGIGPEGEIAEADEFGQLIFGMSGSSGHYKLEASVSADNPVVNFEGGLYGADVSAKSEESLPKDEWCMVTVTLDGENMHLYINGELSAQAEQTVIPDDLGMDLLRIGSSFWGPPTLNALIDEAAVWPSALSAEEVALLYAENAVKSYSESCVMMISEAEDYNTAIETNCFFDEELKEASDIAWADGLMGKAIDMGQSYREHYRFSVEPAWEAKGFTFNTWINWRGAGIGPEGEIAEADEFGQLIFGMSGSSGHYKLEASVSADNPVVNFEGGLYGADISAKSEESLPKDEWCMVTVTLDGENMSLYINGELSAQAEQTVIPDDLGMDLLRIGSSFWGPPTLNALIDEAAVWPRALSVGEIAALYSDMEK